jgi:NAD(P)-dependent dehydrogenase (short-subunit alcohol dehydrogenase family)
MAPSKPGKPSVPHTKTSSTAPSSTAPRALVTGGSRGIGAKVAIELANQGCDITLCYHEKHKRAASVAAVIARYGRRCDLVSGDLTRQDDLERVIQQIGAYEPYNAIVLSANGGLEPGKDLPYAMALNCYAPVALATAAMPLCAPDANVIYVTSHGAHFYYHQPVLPLYAHVALSMQSGEQCLRRMSDLFARHQARLHVVSSDIIEGTTTASLIDRAIPGFLRRRREQVGRLPSIDEFADAIVAKALSRRTDDSGVQARWCGSVEPYLTSRAYGDPDAYR